PRGRAARLPRARRRRAGPLPHHRHRPAGRPGGRAHPRGDAARARRSLVTLTDVIGHAAAVARLARAAREDRPAPAYLFSGPAGVGKRTLADAFTSELLCATPGPDGACGVCAQCVRVAGGTHPDVRIVVRED